MDPKFTTTEPAVTAGGIRGVTLLIVEDSPVQSELLRRVLEGAGYKVIAASNGAEGLAMARANPPAAVVSDINMPVMDGYALCHAIRDDAVLKHTPVILLTMLSDPQDVIGGLNAGADAYVTKPYNVPSLVSRVGLLLTHPPVPPPAVERRKLEVRMAGEIHLVDAHGPRMLNLLVSTYENAVLQNRELLATQQALEDLNQHLEQRVLEKTAELASSERRFRSLIEHASDLVAVVDAQGRIAYISPSVMRLGGYDVAEVLGTHYLDYAHAGDREATAAGFAELLGNPGNLHVTEFRFRHKDGAWVTLESIAGNALDDPAIMGIVINSRDITERKHAEEKIAKLNRLYATLSGINMAIVHTANPAELFDRVCEVAVEKGKFTMAWIGTVEGSDQMIAPVARRGLSQDDMAAVRGAIGRIAESRSRAATAIRERRIMYTNDYGAEALAATWRAAVTEWSIRGYAALPIEQRGEVVAVLSLYVQEPDFFDPEQLALLEEMRADISFAMDRFDTEAKKAQAEAALRDSEIRFRALIENASDITAVVSQDGTIAYTSPSIKAIAGYAPDELIGSLMAQIIHAEDVQAATLALSESIRVPEEVHRVELRIRMKKGSWRVFDVLVRNQLDQAAIGGVIVNLRDVTERKRGEEELKRLNWALRALGQSNSALVHAGTEKELFQACCDAIAGTGGYPLAWVGLVRDDPARSVEVVAAAGNAIKYLEGFDVVWGDAPHGKGPTGMAVRSGETQVINDLAHSASYLPWIERARVHGLAASISLPIRTNGTIGVLAVFSREADAFGRPEVDLFQELAADISYGVISRRTLGERDRLQREQLVGAERLKSALIGTIGAVALTVEKRDPYTAGHQQRVAELCVAIGRKLDFPADRLEGLRLGATIHDIGKIYVPAEILNRPGKLSAIEFEIIKSHPQVGYDIVKDVKFPWPVTDMILQHHERLDGSGYPQGLKGDATILEARILAVADVIEAMSSHRPYRPGLGIDAALEELVKNRRRCYDPAAADACADLFRNKEFSWA